MNAAEHVYVLRIPIGTGLPGDVETGDTVAETLREVAGRIENFEDLPVGEIFDRRGGVICHGIIMEDK